MLEQLRKQLTAAEVEARKDAFDSALEFIDRAAEGGGIRAMCKKSYPVPARLDRRRIDIEILSGEAFLAEQLHKEVEQ